MKDPRGPIRTITKIVEPWDPNSITKSWTELHFDCGHSGYFASHFCYKVGSQTCRCLQCHDADN